MTVSFNDCWKRYIFPFCHSFLSLTVDFLLKYSHKAHKAVRKQCHKSSDQKRRRILNLRFGLQQRTGHEIHSKLGCNESYTHHSPELLYGLHFCQWRIISLGTGYIWVYGQTFAQIWRHYFGMVIKYSYWGISLFSIVTPCIRTFVFHWSIYWARGSIVEKALRYKSEGLFEG
jgi:hypothetical protein